MTYVHAATQTMWAGLSKADIRSDILLSTPDTMTPPAETIMDKQHDMDSLAVATQLGTLDPLLPAFKSLLHKRQKHLHLPAHIAMPSLELEDNALPSPPPTLNLLSPLPAVNKLHAGHTPLVPRALSPVQDDAPHAPAEQIVAEDENTSFVSEDQPLLGPLVLPTNPVDGAADHIALDVLDDVLEKVAQEQLRFSKLKDASEPTTPPPEYVNPHSPSRSRNTSTDSRKCVHTEVVDGVTLKTPPLNFGVPIGQV